MARKRVLPTTSPVSLSTVANGTSAPLAAMSWPWHRQRFGAASAKVDEETSTANHV